MSEALVPKVIDRNEGTRSSALERANATQGNYIALQRQRIETLARQLEEARQLLEWAYGSLDAKTCQLPSQWIERAFAWLEQR